MSCEHVYLSVSLSVLLILCFVFSNFVFANFFVLTWATSLDERILLFLFLIVFQFILYFAQLVNKLTYQRAQPVVATST